LRTIAVLNQKGGVGKTTTTVNTAAALAEMGCKVIAIDFDPQAHLTIHLGVEPQSVTAGAYEVLTQSAPFEGSLKEIRPNLWLLGANINLVGAETELVNVVGREIVLREAMQSIQAPFDFCFIDCAPSLGLLSLNALAASQEVLIPLQPHFLALQGFGKLLQTIDLVSKRINRDLKVTGVLLCMYDARSSLPNEVRADIERFLNNARGSACAWADAQLLSTYVRRNIKLAEAPSYGQTIFEYDPGCNGAEDYRNIARFFVGLLSLQPGQQAPAPQEQVQPEPAAAETQVTRPPQSVESSAQQVTPPSEPQQDEARPEPVPIEIREISSPARQSPQPVEAGAPQQTSPQPDPGQTGAPNETPPSPDQPMGL
jgi:chromosome partitioning protein